MGTEDHVWLRPRPAARRALFAVALCGIVFTATTKAQNLQPCDAVRAVSGYKVLLDEIKFNAGQMAQSDQLLMDLLKFQLRNRLEAMDSDLNIRYRLIRCPGRMPEGPTSFPPDIANDLVNRDVVLEVWGAIFPRSQGHREVWLNYAMLPLGTSANAFFLRKYEPPAGASPDQLVDWLAKAKLNELSAYALVARAVRMVANSGPRAFDQANIDLAIAASSLRAAFGPAPTAPQTQLLQYIADRKCQVMRDSRTNSTYKGSLKNIPENVLKHECP